MKSSTPPVPPLSTQNQVADDSSKQYGSPDVHPKTQILQPDSTPDSSIKKKKKVNFEACNLSL